MRTIILYGLIILSLFLSCSSEKRSNLSVELKSDLEKKNLYGSVNSVKETSYSIVKIFDELSKGDVLNESYQIFDKYGNVTEEIYFDSLNKGNNWKLVKVYNADGMITEFKRYNSIGKMRGRTVYWYSDTNKLIREVSYDQNESPQYKTIYTYDKTGKLKTEISFTPDSTSIHKSTFEYNEIGKLIKVISSDTGNAYLKYTYVYDNNGNIAEETRSEQDELSNITDYKVTYVYDDKRNIIKQNGDKYAQGNWYFTYEYEFDEHKNWIKKTTHVNGVPKMISERIIDYNK